jgi:hypothetical protein
MSMDDRLSAAGEGDITQLKLLVSVANVEDTKESSDGEQWTVLAFACLFGHMKCVMWLLEHCNANVDSCALGKTPLMWASANGHADICKVLIRHHADIEAVNNSGQSALWHAFCNQRDDDDCTRLLIEKGATIPDVFNGPDGEIFTPVGVAAIYLPDWARSFIAQREQCRQSAIVLLASLRKGRVSSFRGNGKDVATMIAKMIWETRNTEVWATTPEAKKVKD